MKIIVLLSILKFGRIQTVINLKNNTRRKLKNISKYVRRSLSK